MPHGQCVMGHVNSTGYPLAVPLVREGVSLTLVGYRILQYSGKDVSCDI